MSSWRRTASRVLVGFAVLFGVLALVVVTAMVLVQSEWAERRIENLIGERSGREVDLEGLKVLAAWPPQVELDRLRIANPDWARDDALIDARGLRATFEVAPLLRGQVMTMVALDDATVGLEKRGDDATWNLDARKEDEGGEGGTKLPVRSISIGELRVAYFDEEDETDVLVRAGGDLGREGRPFQAQAEGEVRGEPLKASARAPAVPLNADQPVQLGFEVSLGENKAAGEVALRAGADALQSIEGRLEVSGSSFAALNNLARAELPESAAYRAAARIRHEGGRWEVRDFQATLGKSDLQGSASFEPRPDRPFLRATLTSSLFDLKETGIKPKVEEELKEEKYLFPRDPWPTEGMDQIDADIELTIEKIRNARPVPLDALTVRVVLDNASLRIDPVKISLASGTVSGRIALNAAESPEEASALIDIRGLRLSRLFPKVKDGETALGRLNGRIELSGRGSTPAELLGASNGRILFAAERGTASGLIVEVLGLDAAEAVSLLGRKNTKLPLRCAVVDLAVKNGNAKVSTFVIDASDTVLSVEGSAHLGKETLALTARAEPRDASPFTLRTPANITGTFLDPKVKPHVGPLAGRAAAAIALGAINPLLALIPFVDPGGDPEGGCQPQKR